MIHRSRYVLAAVTVTAVLAPGAPAHACRPDVVQLNDLGYGGDAAAISGDTVVGDVLDASGRSEPAIWHDGRLTIPSGLTGGFAGDVNRRGEIVGVAGGFLGPLFAQAFADVDGAIHLLAPNDGTPIYARRVNERGQVAGVSGDHAVRWDSFAAPPRPLSPANGLPFSFAKGINDAGTVAGDSDAADGTPFSTLWYSPGFARVLASGLGPGQPSDLFAINDWFEAVGESYAVDSSGDVVADEATAWSPWGRPTLVPSLPQTIGSVALNVSDRGIVVGLGFDQNGLSHGLIWSGRGPARTLPVPGLSYGTSQSDVHAIDDTGTAVGGAGPAQGPASATVWTCATQQSYVPGDATTRAAPATGLRVPARSFFARRRQAQLSVGSNRGAITQTGGRS